MFRSNFVQRFAASHCDQKEQTPAHDIEVFHDLIHRLQIIGRLLRYQCIDLDRNAEQSGRLGGLHRRIEASRHVADSIVAKSIGAIQAESDAFDPMLFQLRDGIAGQPVSGARRDRYPDSQRAGIVNQVIQIFAFERVAACQYQVRQWIAKGGHLIQQPYALQMRQLLWIGARHGFCAAVAAGQRASAGCLPVNQKWILRIIALAISA
jgi:hypothetical protein